MGLLTKHEDRPTPASVYNWRVYACACVAAFAALMIGYDSAFIGTTISLASFEDEFGFNKMSTAQSDLISSNIVSLFQSGAFFGAFAAYPVGHFLGRKTGLLISSLIFLLGAGLMLGANGQRGLGMLYGGRVLAGFGVGMCSNLTPIYISELAPPAIRGRLVGMYELGWQVGGLVGFWINDGVEAHIPSSHKQWIIPFAIQLIPAGLLAVGSLWIRESPRWLMTKGRRELALKNLCWIRQLTEEDTYMLEEIAAIDAAIEEQRSGVGLGFWHPFVAMWSDKMVLRRLGLGTMLFFWQNASGINAINYYSPTVFKSIGLDSALLSTGLFGVVKTCMTIIWLFFLIDNLGRRQLLLWGALLGSLCLWYVGGYIAIAQPTEHPSSHITSGGISAVFFFFLWTAIYTPTWNGTPWVINSEMFDQNVRTLAQAFAAMSNWLWNFLVARFTPQMFAKMGFGVYFFFAALTLFSIPFTFFLIPETKSIPLESMDRLFDPSMSARKAHDVVMAEVRAAEEDFRLGVANAHLSDSKEKAEHLEDV